MGTPFIPSTHAEITCEEDAIRYAADQLIKQGKRSVHFNSKPSGCRYRHNELKCAIGYLILDEHYSDALEGHSIQNSSVYCALQKSLPEIWVNVCNLEHLQGIHDFAYNDACMVEYMTKIRDSTTLYETLYQLRKEVCI